MKPWLNNNEYAENPVLASSDLAKALFRGELAMFLGAGVSKPIGLPSWPNLVRACLQEAKLPYDHVTEKTDIASLQREAGTIRRKLADDKRYRELVSHCLYADSKPRTNAVTTQVRYAA